MDDVGFRTRRRADKEQRKYGVHGQDETQPMEEDAYSDEQAKAKYEPPLGQETLNEVPYHVPGGESKDDHSHVDGQAPLPIKTGQGDTTSAPGLSKDASEEERRRSARGLMEPHLQVMCGPMLRYATVTDAKVWIGFAMIVTADTGSDYSHEPTLTMSHKGLKASSQQTDGMVNGADATRPQPNGTVNGDGAHGGMLKHVLGEKIYTHLAQSGNMSFWRFKLEIPLQDEEMDVKYSINGGKSLDFFVPGKEQNFRWIAHSCNGFSAGVDPKNFNGPYPLWEDILRGHAVKPFHLLVGGGDQIYNDKLVNEAELQPWLKNADGKKKMAMECTPEIRGAIDRFAFNWYCEWFRGGAFGRAIGRIPMSNQLDDHDLIDGFGSYDDDLMQSPIFNTIGSRNYFWYLLFQNFLVPDHDDKQLGVGKLTGHVDPSILLGSKNYYIPYPSHSFLLYLGPDVALLSLDCRAERRKDRICTAETYAMVFDQLRKLPNSVSQVVILLGVPILYPRMVFAEKFLASKFNPLVALSRAKMLGLASFTNKFNADAELLDDLSDHYCATPHKPERNWLIGELTKIARERKLRITFLSGDVHCAAVGRTYDIQKPKPEEDPKYILNVITSAIVNTPPPDKMLLFMSKLGSKTHKTLHKEGIDEDMVPLFKKDVAGRSRGNALLYGRRNYSIQTYLHETRELEFSFQIERDMGPSSTGETVRYPIKAPAVGW
ncbi:uncharacterized protein L969DRAFT_15927 [Mixia osmundae IAM 14324]|nr:uncharacterized protein L969DRAFT_15927 [Mixia osmundae IAM 14324]KEI40569.1 hypothetical protein L969DRAFT_15927 [Mixia osmundae IAM 14324]